MSTSSARGAFVDLYVNNVLIIGSAIGQNLNRIVRSVYLGFAGDLVFFDTAGDADPVYSGLGSRWQLLYLPAASPASTRCSICRLT
jgi:hypothetical protein